MGSEIGINCEYRNNIVPSQHKTKTINFMIITIKKDTNNKEIDKKLLSLKPRKQFRSKLFLGKIKWEEDLFICDYRIGAIRKFKTL